MSMSVEVRREANDFVKWGYFMRYIYKLTDKKLRVYNVAFCGAHALFTVMSHGAINIFMNMCFMV